MIEVRSLTKTFGSGQTAVTALSDVTFTVENSDIFGIIGMSGAGKSTFLRCLSMLETPSSGEILLRGVDISKLKGAPKRAAHRDMGVVFQGYNLLAQSTVAQNIAFPLKLVKYSKDTVNKRVDELLGLVGLRDKAGAYPSQLSGGQKQRVAIARALATSPSVLLCDEPTSALDSLTTKNILDLLRDINRQLGVTIIIITHELSVVRAICSHTAVIDGSKLVEIGRTDDLFDSPKSDIAKLLLGVSLP
ncbi:MAG: ATP-binding cassette domain-containing protein [Oscillospiraceae bacterium]|jgi:D-methionine transport system ATP-binding protein|nr:ATP-binding cassette domain-containing protein [Oscillospiraceae bacterium]